VLGSWGYPAPGRVAEALLECGADPSAPILDLGCGTGLAGSALRAKGFTGDITGVDISAESLRVAAVVRPNVYAELVQGNLDDGLPFLPSSHFGSVVSVGVLR
jgi:predicted TPR repeat methyltransferase